MGAFSYDAQVSNLAGMEDGWDGRKSKAPTFEAMAVARAIWVCPLGDGGVQIELHAGGMNVEIDVGPEGNIRCVCTSGGHS